MNLINCSKAIKPLWEVFVEPRTTEYSSPEAEYQAQSLQPPASHATSMAQCLLYEEEHSSGDKPLEKGHSRLRAIVCSFPSSLLTSPVSCNANRSNRSNLSQTCLHCSKLKTHRMSWQEMSRPEALPSGLGVWFSQQGVVCSVLSETSKAP